MRCGTATSSARELTASGGHSTETAAPSDSALAKLELRTEGAPEGGLLGGGDTRVLEAESKQAIERGEG